MRAAVACGGGVTPRADGVSHRSAAPVATSQVEGSGVQQAQGAVLIHGAGGGAWEWAIWQRILAAHGLAADAVELEPAPPGLADTGLDDYRRQVEAALQARPRPRVAVGASLGGLLAAACAGEADALVLVNPLPPSPWVDALSAHHRAAVVPWGSQARFEGTRRALPDADSATTLLAHRRWRDESGRALREAHMGVPVMRPACPVLFVVSEGDDVPPQVNRAWAAAWGADVVTAPTRSHVGPLLGRCAAGVARDVAHWLRGRLSPR